ncbi:MAG: hypothetical protein FWD34_10085 [Oscillospiraceae bacterium]|nr:hypothetical protein [Oscillospiraceae bacterium]
MRRIKVLSVLFVIITLSRALTVGATEETEKRLFDNTGILEMENYLPTSDGYSTYSHYDGLNARLNRFTEYYVSAYVSYEYNIFKTTQQMIEESQAFYSDTFGKNTDGIMLFIYITPNSEDFCYIYIYTSGICSDIFGETRTDNILTEVSRYIESDEIYLFRAIYEFIDLIYDYNTMDNAPEPVPPIPNIPLHRRIFTVSNLPFAFVASLIANAFIIHRIIKQVKKDYRLQRPQSATDYTQYNAVVITKKTDTYIRTYGKDEAQSLSSLIDKYYG